MLIFSSLTFVFEKEATESGKRKFLQDENFTDKKLCYNNIDIDINIDDIVLGDGKFFTMLDAYWWALITMTTVSHPFIFCCPILPSYKNMWKFGMIQEILIYNH